MRFRANRKSSLLVFIIFIIIFIVLILSVTNGKHTENFIETKATIDSIIEGATSDDSSTVYVTYKVDGKTYQHQKLDVYSSSMHQNDEITILYNPENPYEISGFTADFKKRMMKFVYLFIGVAIVFVIAMILRRMRGR